MFPGYRIPSRRARFAWVAAALMLMAFGALGARLAHPSAPVAVVCTTMTATDMANLSATHFRDSPAHANATTVAPAATFLVSDYRFDADHNPSTQVDVVNIVAGQSVMFQWVSGYHTSTSGNPSDLDAGTLWDIPIDPFNPQPTIVFPAPGTYPFHCLFHGAYFGMTGTVVVSPSATPTAKSTWGRIKARYR